MKKYLLLLLVCFTVFAMLNAKVAVRQESQSAQTRNTRAESIWIQETFDDVVLNDPANPNAWYTVDEYTGEPPHQWHLTNIPFFLQPSGGQDFVWWMGNPEYGYHGGYDNGQVLALLTPEVVLPADGDMFLTFDFNLFIEPSDEMSPPWDGWDGAVVMITVLEDGEWSAYTPLIPMYPAYDANYFYCWDYCGLGANIPGWASFTDDGVSGTWREARFDLSDYAGETVKVIWVFGSDELSCTNDSYGDPSWFGFVVDNINVADIFNPTFTSADDTHGMTTEDLLPIEGAAGGDLWGIVDDGTNNFLRCPAEGTYPMMMKNWVYTDTYRLPTSGEIMVDFRVRGRFNADDYVGFRFEITADGGTTWRSMSDPTGDDSSWWRGANISNWQWFRDAFGGWLPISMYAGQDVQFRICFESRLTAGNAAHTGMWIDDFTIFVERATPAPKNLEIVADATTATLNWVNPATPGPVQEGWINHGNMVPGSSVGVTGGAGYTAAQRFTPLQLVDMGAAGGYLTKIAFIPAYGPTDAFPDPTECTYSAKVWTGGTDVSNAGELVFASAPILDSDIPEFPGAAGDPNDDWDVIGNYWYYTINIPTPIEIPIDSELRIGIEVDNSEGYPLIVDTLPHINFYGNLLNTSGTWRVLQFSNSTVGNWLIFGYVTDSDGNPIGTIGNVSPQALASNDVAEPIYAQSITRSYNITRNLPVIDEYKIFRRANNITTLAGTVDGDETTFVDNAPDLGLVNYYYVQAVYGDAASEPSNTVNAFFMSPTQTLLVHDDGEAEDMQRGARIIVNRFEPAVQGQYKVAYLEYYIYQVATTSIRFVIYADNDGMPGAERVRVLIDNPTYRWTTGWNFMQIPANNYSDTVFEKGEAFYIGFDLVSSSSNSMGIGLDTTTDPAGLSYTRLTSGQNQQWGESTNGVYMIRPIIDETVLNESDKLAPTNLLTAKNYPNPFNPETTIRYNMPKQGKVNISVYNIKGQLVKNILTDEVHAGENRVVWNGKDNQGRDVSSGIYFYKISTDTENFVNKMLLMK